MKPIVSEVPKSGPSARERLGTKAAAVTYRVLRWADVHLAFGLRSVIGVLFIGGGVLWFLPILGIWMLPLGGALIALDIPWTRHRVHRWMNALKKRAEKPPSIEKLPR
ncbi:MAG: hypothetical protein J4F45_07790 [Pseudomonadales bacterium]|nr:hypothetical protein [Pseudomonadales bacterium]